MHGASKKDFLCWRKEGEKYCAYTSLFSWWLWPGYIYIHVYVCIHIYAHIYIYIYTYTYTHIHTYTVSLIPPVCLNVDVHIWISISMHIYVCVTICVYIYTHTCIYVWDNSHGVSVTHIPLKQGRAKGTQKIYRAFVFRKRATIYRALLRKVTYKDTLWRIYKAFAIMCVNVIKRALCAKYLWLWSKKPSVQNMCDCDQKSLMWVICATVILWGGYG